MSETLNRLTEALAGRYAIEREIGAGGMATVYVAHDIKHDRKVALKLLRPELAAVLGAQRFLKEIQVTANLQHPHILPLYDSGEAGGLLFYVMPLIQGDTLRDRLNRQKLLPVDEAVRIAAQVAGALDFAHKQGVVHRDIKPENILIHEGEAMLADFGIALAVSEAGGDRLTETGLSLGTPHYMSPEQATGEREIDARSDIYSLGAVTYEMLAGEPPVTGPNARAMIAKLITARPTPVGTMRDAVSAELDAAVMRALSKEPADRFASAKEFGAALVAARPGNTHASAAAAAAPAPSAASMPAARPARARGLAPRLLTAGVVLAIVLSGALWWSSRATSMPAAGPSIRSIAVLPFAERNADSAAFLGDGIAETLIYALGKVPGLKVAAQTSSFTFKGKEADLAAIGEKLGVASVLTGSVQRAGTKLRVTVRLEDVADHAERWTEQYDREMSDVFALQDDIARAVVVKLQAGAGGASATIVNAGTKNVDAYQAYLQGRFTLAQRGAGIRQAIPHFERAVATDSTYAQAWAGLADCYMLLRTYSEMPDAEAVPKFERAIGRAFTLDSMLAPARATRAFWLQTYAGDFAGAEREFRRAIALDSTYVPAHYWYAAFLSGARFQFADGVAQARLAVSLDPLSAHAVSQLSQMLGFAGDSAGAVREARRSVTLNPNWQNYRALGMALLSANRMSEAIATLDSALVKSDSASWALMSLASAHIRSGDKARARGIYDALKARHARGRAGSFAVAMAAFSVEGLDAARPWLSRAREEHDALLGWPGLVWRAELGRPRGAEWQAFGKAIGVPDPVLVGGK